MYVQAAYLIPNTKIEPYALVGGVWGLSDAVWEYTAGANYYIHGRALKLTLDLTWTSESAIGGAYRNVGYNADMMLYRFQVQAATY